MWLIRKGVLLLLGSWVWNALSSSVGKKYLMAVTGLSLCGFLVVHLAGNLLLLKGANDDGEYAYDQYAETLHANPLLPLAETGLFAIFIVHLGLAVSLSRANRKARGTAYLKSHSKRDDLKMPEGGRPDYWMLVTGLAVLAYLVLHIANFKIGVGIEGGGGEHITQVDAVGLLKNWGIAGAYLAGFLFLMAHLAHGFASAFQSLGINHPKYNKWIRWCGWLFAVLVSSGFALIVVCVHI